MAPSSNSAYLDVVRQVLLRQVRETMESVMPAFDDLLVRQVVDFVTGSDKPYIRRFDSAETARLEGADRAQARCVVVAIKAIVEARSLPFSDVLVDRERWDKLQDLLRDVDQPFDVLDCKARIAKHLSREDVVTDDEREMIDAVVAYLTGVDDSSSRLASILSDIESGGEPFSEREAAKCNQMLFIMLRFYPKAVKIDRQVRFSRVLAKTAEKWLLEEKRKREAASET